MKKSLFNLIVLNFLIFFSAAHGQTPSDELMMPAKDACILLNYEFGGFEEYWEGSTLRDNETVAKVNRTTILPMVAIGIFDKLNLYVGVPYIITESTDPNGGKYKGVQGYQDLGLALKYQFINEEISSGEFSVLGTVGFSTPITNYLSDYMPYSLGFGAPELSYRGIFQYKMKSNIYFRTSLAYLWRGYTEIERDYYYNNGSYYSSFMDVPNAWNFEGVIGAWLMDNSLRMELNYWSLKSTSGDNIRAYNAPQPTNKVEMERVGLFVHYFVPSVEGLGFLAYHNRVVNGLNAPKMNSTGLGITYQFKFIK